MALICFPLCSFVVLILLINRFFLHFYIPPTFVFHSAHYFSFSSVFPLFLSPFFLYDTSHHLFISSFSFFQQTFFSKAVSNDTFFLSIISVVDYSILVGFDEDSHEIVVGIIDYMRQVNT